MTEFDSYSDDGVSAVINVHTEAHLFSLPNDCLWYDKLWGPSQRVVTLFYESIMIYVLLSIMGEPEKEDELG